ncbi:hypothetical protein ACS0PU_012333 [Formica fusca]
MEMVCFLAYYFIRSHYYIGSNIDSYIYASQLLKYKIHKKVHIFAEFMKFHCKDEERRAKRRVNRILCRRQLSSRDVISSLISYTALMSSRGIARDTPNDKDEVKKVGYYKWKERD